MQEALSVKRFSFDSATVWILGIVAFLTTVIFIPGSPVSVYGTKVTFLAVGSLIALVAYVVSRLVRGNIVFPPLMLLGAVWLVPAAYGLSALFSGTSLSMAFFGVEFEPDTLGFMGILAALATLAALSVRQASQYKLFYQIASVAFAVVMLGQIGILIAARITPSVSAVTNLVGSFSDLALIAGMGVVLLLLALRFLSLSGRLKIAAWCAVALGLFLLVLANAFVVWLLVALVALALFIEAVMKRRAAGMDFDLEGVSTLMAEDDADYGGSEARFLGAPLIVLLIALFFMIGGATIGNAIAGSLGINVVDVRPSWQSTFDVGSHTYASSPFFGSGPGTFGQQWLKFRDHSLNETIFWNVDFTTGIGAIPTSFITTGIIGVLAWLVFIGFFLYSGVRALLFRMPTDAFMRFVSLSSFVGALYMLIAAFLLSPGVVPLAVGFVFLGIFISSLRYGKGRLDWGIVFAKSPRVGFAIVFLLTLLLLASIGGIYVMLTRYLAYASYGDASQALSAGNVDAADTAIARSLSYAPSERAYQLATSVALERMRRIAADASLSASTAQQQFQTALTAGVNAGVAATALGPNNYQNWVALGTVYQSVAGLGIQGSYDSAKSAYLKASALNPSTPILPYVLGQLEITQSHGAAAEEQLLASVSLKRDYVPAILLLSQLEVQLGKAKEALQAAEAAAYFVPNEPSVLFQVGILRIGTGDTNGAIAALDRAVELNPQYANARYFLAAMYATQGKYDEALTQMQAVAALSEENAAAVASDMTQLEAKKNPFPPSRLKSLGIPTPPVAEPTVPAPQQ